MFQKIEDTETFEFSFILVQLTNLNIHQSLFHMHQDNPHKESHLLWLIFRPFVTKETFHRISRIQIQKGKQLISGIFSSGKNPFVSRDSGGINHYYVSYLRFSKVREFIFNFSIIIPFP